jgi:hypothetical protein
VLRPTSGGQSEHARSVRFSSSHAMDPIAKWRAGRLTRSLSRALGIGEGAPPSGA